MQAIFVDPFTRTIKPVQIEHPEALGEFYGLMQCDLIDTARINEVNRDAFFVHDEGLLIEPEFQQYFTVLSPGREKVIHMLAGRAVLVGADDEGNTVAPVTSLAEIKRRVMWEGNGWYARIIRDRLLSVSGTVYPLDLVG